MTRNELLAAARALCEIGWTQAASARTADGTPLSAVDLPSDSAVCWCMFGAIQHVKRSQMEVTRDAADLAEAALDQVVGTSCFLWNDMPGRTQEEVLNAFEKAMQEPL